MEVWYSWVVYLNPVYYTYVLSMAAIFPSLSFDCVAEGESSSSYSTFCTNGTVEGQEVLNHVNALELGWPVCLIATFIFLIFFRAVAFFVLLRKWVIIPERIQVKINGETQDAQDGEKIVGKESKDQDLKRVDSSLRNVSASRVDEDLDFTSLDVEK